jgi:sigma-B regulation protein RsbU (phosphoserine phosphatase)
MESKVAVLEDKAKKADALEQSVKVASARQRRLLPARPPEIPDAEVGLVYKPAEHVSGDFYDFVPLPDGRLGFIIGDVAGHGIEAGILMGMAKKVLSLRLEESGDPITTIFKANNDLFRELDRQSFVTAFVCIYDPAGRSIAYARAGHNPPLLFNPARDPKLVKFDAGGLGLGISKGPAFENTLVGETVEVQSGDIFLLYTDGLVEARNQAGEEFQIERIVSTLEASVDRPTSFILGVLSYELDRFSAGLPQEDDVTAVCVRFK